MTEIWVARSVESHPSSLSRGCRVMMALRLWPSTTGYFSQELRYGNLWTNQPGNAGTRGDRWRAVRGVISFIEISNA